MCFLLHEMFIREQVNSIMTEKTDSQIDEFKKNLALVNDTDSFSEFINNIINIINSIASTRIYFAFAEGFVTSFEATIYSNLPISWQKIVIKASHSTIQHALNSY